MKFTLAANIEDSKPIRLREGRTDHYLTAQEARTLLRQLGGAVKEIGDHFLCAGDMPWFSRTVRCYRDGKVKINGRWWCKQHAKQIGGTPEATR